MNSIRMGQFQDGILFFFSASKCNVLFSAKDFSVYRLYMLRVTTALNQNKDYVTENVLFFLAKNPHPFKAASL